MTCPAWGPIRRRGGGGAPRTEGPRREVVYRVAARHGLAGWVRYTAGGVVREAEGADDDLGRFLEALPAEAPPLAVISALRASPLPPVGESSFLILSSEAGENLVQVALDGDVCGDCLSELFDPADRRHRTIRRARARATTTWSGAAAGPAAS